MGGGTQTCSALSANYHLSFCRRIFDYPLYRQGLASVVSCGLRTQVSLFSFWGARLAFLFYLFVQAPPQPALCPALGSCGPLLTGRLGRGSQHTRDCLLCHQHLLVGSAPFFHLVSAVVPLLLCPP